jgi:hypothetical protein
MIRALVCLLVLTQASIAQSWQVTTQDDGSFYFAMGFVPGKVGIYCGGRSPQRLSPQATGNVEPRTTQPGQVGLEMSDTLIGANQTGAARGDVMAVIGALGYRLPQIIQNELVGVQEQFLRRDDSLVAALQSGEPLEFRTDTGGRQTVPIDGAETAIATALSYCDRLANARPQVDLVGAAQTYIFQACGGQAQASQGYLLQGDLDVDGQDDIVIDWSLISCPGPLARPFCGASKCSVDVYLSRKYRPGAQPDGYLAVGVTMQASPFGGAQLHMGGGISDCGGLGACYAIWRWDGRQLAVFPQ